MFDLEDKDFLPVVDKIYLRQRLEKSPDDDDLYLSIQRYEIKKLPKLPKPLERWVDIEVVSFNKPEPFSKITVTEEFSDEPERVSAFKNVDEKSELPEVLKKWVTKNDKGVYEKIDVRDKELFFVDYPELTGLYEEWIKNKWQQWRDENYDYLLANNAYDRLYALRSFLKTESDSYDLIWGHDIVTWKKGSEEVFHPTFFTPVILDFDTDTNTISVRKDDQLKTFCDVSYIREVIDDENKNLADIDELSERINAEEDFDVWNFYMLHQYLRKFMRFISPDGDSKYNERNISVSTTVRPTAFNCHNLFLFKKSGKSWAEYAKKIQADIANNGQLTPFLADLITGEFVEPGDDELNRALFDSELADGELLFPLASNKEQQQISKQIDGSYGCVVQGPPGTGKTHTIANLVSRFLAQGKTVLVTSQTGQALSVLKQKLPHQIQNLAVSQVDDDSKVNDLQNAVSEINTNLSDTNKFTESTEESAKNELDLIRKEIAKKNYEYQRKLLIDSNESLEVGVDVLNPVQAAKIVSNFEANESLLITDKVDFSLDLPFKQADFDNFIDALTRLDTDAWDYADYDNFPAVASLPKLKVVKDYIKTRESLSANEEKLHQQYVPDEKQLGSLKKIVSYIEEYKKQDRSFEIFKRKLKERGIVSVDKTVQSVREKTSHEEVLQFISKIVEIKKSLNSFNEDWEDELLKSVSNDQEKTRWIKVIEHIESRISGYRSSDEVLIGKKVLVGDIDIEAGLAAVATIESKVKNDNFPSKLSFIFDSGARNLLKVATVNGKSVTSPEMLGILKAHFLKQKLVQEISLLWSQAFEVQKTKKEFVEPFNIVDFESDLATVKRIVSFNDKKDDLSVSLSKFLDIIDTNITSLESLEKLQDTFLQIESLFKLGELDELIQNLKQEFTGEQVHPVVKKLYTCIDKKESDKIKLIKEELSALNSRKDVSHKFIELESQVFNKALESALTSKTASAEISRLSSLIEKGDISGIEDFYNELPNLIEQQKLSHQIKKLNDVLHKFIPQTVKNIMKIIANGENIKLDVEENWKYARLNSWLDFLHKGDTIQQLSSQIEVLKNKERDQIRKIIEIAAWINLKTKVTKPQKEALASFALSMKKRGKGTGKYAAKHLSDARNALMVGKDAVPVWIMPINTIHQLFPDPKAGMFDVVIFDEASQVDARGLNIAYLGKKLLVVGDDEQVSPTSFTLQSKVTDLITRYISDIPNSTHFSSTSSLFDIAKIKMTETVTLTEHFRSIEEIIGFSNKLSYDGSLKILRNQLPKDRLDPVLEAVFIEDGYVQTNAQVNKAEAEAVIEKIKEILLDKKCDETKADGVTRPTTIGVISLLGKEQSKLITKMISENIPAKEIEKRNIVCGDPYVFQGDERDIILLSMVKAPDLDNPDATIHPYTASKKEYRQRINVAMSRARNKMVLFHSIPKDKITNRNDLRKQVIDWFYNYKTEEKQAGLKKVREEVVRGRASEFEYAVAEIICNKGFAVIPQYEVAGYRIDLVVQGENARLAIECDGDQYHNGFEKWHEDIERQQIIERSGWQFWRVSGSSFYRHREKALKSLWSKLDEMGIEPTQ